MADDASAAVEAVAADASASAAAAVSASVSASAADAPCLTSQNREILRLELQQLW